MIVPVAFIALAFLLGSIPTGYLLGRLYGTDVRKHGSGNIGATNAARILGKKVGLTTLLIDIGKGALAVHLGTQPLLVECTTLTPEQLSAAMGTATVFGHCFSPFLKFQGGKGVAAALGVFLALTPLAALLAVGVFTIVVLSTKYVGLGSVIAALSLPISLFCLKETNSALIAAVLVASLVILRHRGNISRLLTGKEHRLGSSRTCS